MIPFTYPSKVVDGETACVVKQITPGPTDEAWKHYIPIKESYRLNKTNTYDTNGSVAASGLGDITGKTSWIDYIPVASVATSNPWRTDADGHIPLSFVEGGLSATQINAPASSVRDAMNTLGSIDFQPHNVIRNSAAAGAVAGTPGTLPTNWTVSGLGTLTQEVIGTGTDSGFPYIDIRFSGTTSTTSLTVFHEIQNQAVASANEAWTASYYAALAGGSLTNISFVRVLLSFNNNTSQVDSAQKNATVTGTLSRVSATKTSAVSTVTRVNSGAALLFSSGVAIDITLRIAAPQLERGSAPRGFVSTSGTAVAPFYGYLLPGAAGARLNTSARTSLAMQQRADGAWEFAPHNGIRNSSAVGSVSGSPGTVPTNWAFSSPSGITRTIVGTGIENGLPYIDLKFAGTTGAAFSNSGLVSFEGASTIAASIGQTWTCSAYVSLVGGTLANVGLRIRISETNGGVTVANSNSLFVPTATPTRISITRTLTNAATTFVQPTIAWDSPISSAVDFTLRVAAPQLERASFARTFIPTTTAAIHAPAIDWLPTQRVYGLRSEEARTNSIRNNTMVGAVVGSPGTFPTNWGSGTANGITASVVQLGTDSTTGMPFIEVRYTGTATANNIAPSFEPNFIVAASDGQAWSWSTWMAFVGSGRPSSTTMRINARNAGGSVGNMDTVVSPTTSMSRFSVSGTLAFPTLTHITPFVRFGLVISQEYDFTVRYVAPQLELGAFVTSPILTYGETATRAADTLVVPNNAWIGQTAASIAVDYVNYTTATGSLISTDDGSTNNRVITFTNGGTTPAVRVVVGGVDQANMNQASVTAGTLGRLSFGVAQDNFAASINGAAVTTDTSGTVPSGQTTMRIGTNVLGAASLNGHITSFRYDNVRLLDQNLIDLTTG